MNSLKSWITLCTKIYKCVFFLTVYVNRTCMFSVRILMIICFIKIGKFDLCIAMKSQKSEILFCT